MVDTSPPAVRASGIAVTLRASSLNECVCRRTPPARPSTHTHSSGVYITWRTEDGSDCTRVGAHSKCFCNHYYGEHKQGLMKSQCLSEGCKCGRFEFVPVRPEECGMWWLPRRPDFNVHTWEPKCSCKHGPSKHSCKFSKKCRMRGCGCSSFHSDFACVVCDKKWESHETVWETRDEREADGKPVGADWLPLAEVPEMQQMVFMDRGGALACASSCGRLQVLSVVLAVCRPAW